MPEEKVVLPEKMLWAMSGTCQDCEKKSADMEGDGWVTSDYEGFRCPECEEKRLKAWRAHMKRVNLEAAVRAAFDAGNSHVGFYDGELNILDTATAMHVIQVMKGD